MEKVKSTYLPTSEEAIIFTILSEYFTVDTNNIAGT